MTHPLVAIGMVIIVLNTINQNGTCHHQLDLSMEVTVKEVIAIQQEAKGAGMSMYTTHRQNL